MNAVLLWLSRLGWLALGVGAGILLYYASSMALVPFMYTRGLIWGFVLAFVVALVIAAVYAVRTRGIERKASVVLVLAGMIGFTALTAVETLIYQ